MHCRIVLKTTVEIRRQCLLETFGIVCSLVLFTSSFRGAPNISGFNWDRLIITCTVQASHHFSTLLNLSRTLVNFIVYPNFSNNSNNRFAFLHLPGDKCMMAQQLASAFGTLSNGKVSEGVSIIFCDF